MGHSLEVLSTKIHIVAIFVSISVTILHFSNEYSVLSVRVAAMLLLTALWLSSNNKLL
jgi:hypothetical protein